MKFIIKANITAAALFTAEIDARFKSSPTPVQLGEAVKKAVEAKANLRGANLGSANLYGADLRGANLYGADLRGANLGKEIKASGSRPVIQLGPIGEYGEYISAFITETVPFIKTSEFFGPLSEFKKRMRKPGAKTPVHLVWIAACQLIEAHCIAYPPSEK